MGESRDSITFLSFACVPDVPQVNWLQLTYALKPKGLKTPKSRGRILASRLRQSTDDDQQHVEYLLNPVVIRLQTTTAAA